MATSIRFIDVYSFYDDIDAEVIESLLDDFDIICAIRRFEADSDPSDPIDDENPPEKRVSVEEDRADDAKKIIADAITNGILSRDGAFT